MPRVQVQDPFKNTPSLRPTINPQRLPAGVAAPARDNSLMDLAGALSEFNPELRGMIREQQAKAQSDAITQGELKAAELDAQGRMDAINGKLKAYVDDGTIPASQLPYFQRGFNRRTGRELALTGFQSALDDRFKEATAVGGRVDPDAILSEVSKQFREQLPAGDVYAAQGFDAMAAQVSQSFRERANATYQKNYEQAGIDKIANQGVDLLQQHVLADPDTKDATLETFRTYFNDLKATELPKAQTAPFMVKNVVSPMVDDLVARGDFDGADELIESVEGLDVTGQGGLLGNLATTKGELAQMKLSIAERRRRADDPSETYTKKVNAAYFRGTADAKVKLVELGDAVLDPATKKKLVADYAEANKDNPWAVSTYTDYLDKTMREGMTQDTPTAVANVSRMMESTNPAQLASAREALSEMAKAGQISPITELKLEGEIRKREALFGLITEEDARYAERQLYNAEREDFTSKALPVFATGTDYLSEALTPADRLTHRQAVMDFYRETLAGKLRDGAFASTEVAQAALPKLRAESVKEAAAYADTMTKAFLPIGEAKPANAAPPSAGKPTNGTDKAPQLDPLKGVVAVAAEPKSNDPDRNRAAFLSFFAEPFGGSGAEWRVSDAALEGQIGKLTQDKGSFFMRPTSKEENEEAKARLKPVLIYRSVKDSYYGLIKYRERGSDLGDPNYIKRLRELATNLQTYGGAEYLTPEQLTSIGLNPAAFPVAGTKAGLIK